MSGAAPETAHEDDQSRRGAEESSLEFVEAYAVSVDPRALSLLSRSECKQHRAIPLSVSGGTAVVAVAVANEERLAAVRARTGVQTRFVMISEQTLDALLSSRMFAEHHGPAPAPAVAPEPVAQAPAEPALSPSAAAQKAATGTQEPTPAAEVEAPQPSARKGWRRWADPDGPQPETLREQGAQPVAAERAAVEPVAAEPAWRPTADVPEPVPAPAPASAPIAALDSTLVEAVVAAVERRLGALAAAVPAEPVAVPATQAPAAAPSADPALGGGDVSNLLAQIDTAISSWSTLRSALVGFGDELEDAKRNLREAKEGLSVAHAENDQHLRRIRTLETDVAESKALVADARSRLQAAADALDAGADRLEESADLI